MADKELPTVMEILATFTGRAMRADAESHDSDASKAERNFHAGRREAYLQVIAKICGTEVKDIRKGVLGERHDCRKTNSITDNEALNRLIDGSFGN